MRTSRVLLVAALAALSAAADAQPRWTLTGYLMDLPAIQRFGETQSHLFGTERMLAEQVTRLRLRPQVEIGESGFLLIEYEIAALYHSASLFLSAQPEGAARQAVDLSWSPVKSAHFSLNHFIDRAYYRHTFDAVEVTLGRQRIAWGTGRVWNPTDLFNPINPANFAKVEKDGVDGVTAKLPFGSFTDLSLVLNTPRGRSLNGGFRFRTNVAEYDVSLLGGRFDDRIVAGADFAGSLFEAGLRGEGIYSVHPDDAEPGFVKFILGADYQFTSEFYALVEYQFNGEGQIDPGKYELARLAGGGLLNLGTQYLALGGTYLVHPLVTLTAMATANLVDASRFVSMTITWSAAEDISLTAGGQLFDGGQGDEYWYYPQAAFLKAEWYFRASSDE